MPSFTVLIRLFSINFIIWFPTLLWIQQDHRRWFLFFPALFTSAIISFLLIRSRKKDLQTKPLGLVGPLAGLGAAVVWTAADFHLYKLISVFGMALWCSYMLWIGATTRRARD